MVVAEPILAPDTDTISAHLAHVTARWDELAEPVVLELVFLSAEDRATVKDVRRYPPDRISEAVAHVAGMNPHRVNAYAVVNPVRADAPLGPGTRASREHIAAAFFHWADADDGQAAENIRNFVGPPFTFCVLTGTHPTRRPHVYWELEDPTRNFEAWERTQRAIAASLRTDPAVVDPPRIMRIAGTINWPKPKKQAKGYIAELTTLHITDNPSVSSERMARAFAGAPKPERPAEPYQGAGDGAERVPTSELVRRIHSGQGWHDAVIRIVGRLVRKGLSDDDIHAFTDGFTLPGFTIEDTRREVDAAINGARRKGYEREDQGRWEPESHPGGRTQSSRGADAYAFREMTDAERAAVPPYPFRRWQVIDFAAIPYPEFIYGDFYARGYTSVTIAAPKVGKSMLGLAEAVDMASGRGLLTGRAAQPRRVLYFNAEDDQDVVNARVAALLTRYGVPQEDVVGWLFAHSGIDQPPFRLIAGQDPVINEELFAGIEAFCRAEAMDALIFDPLQDLTASPETNDVFRLLGQRLRALASACRVAIGLVHHTRKVAPGQDPSIDDMRGGSALRGTARFNRILVSMSPQQAIQAGVQNHHHFFRIGDVESNLAPPSADVNRWFEKVSIHIGNGHSFGAVQPWEWPDAFAGVSVQDAARVRNAVAEMEDAPPRADVRSAQWVGLIAARILDLDVEDKAAKAKVQSILKKWIETDVLQIAEVKDTAKNRTVKVVLAGSNNPLSTVSE